jgi:hypothetical protein
MAKLQGIKDDGRTFIVVKANGGVVYFNCVVPVPPDYKPNRK